MTAVAESVLTIPGYDAYMRPFTDDDQAAYVDARLATPNYGFSRAGDIVEQRTSLENAFRAMRLGMAAGVLAYGVWSADELAGKVGGYAEQGEMSIDYFLRQDARGQGLASAAVGRFCQVAFEDPLIHSVSFWIYPDNDRSQKVAQRQGAVRTGAVQYDYEVWRLLRSRFEQVTATGDVHA